MKFALIFALVSLVSGCNLYLEGDVPEICKTFEKQNFAGVGLASQLDLVVKKYFELDLSSMPDLDGFDAERTVRLTSVTLIAKNGISRFDFIQNLKVWISSAQPESKLPLIQILEYTRPAASLASSPLVMPGMGVDVFDYYSERKVLMSFELFGRFPADEWGVDFKLCFSARARENL